MNRYLLVLLAITVIVCGCKKNSVVPGNGAPPASGSFLPVTSGSTWTYSVSTKYSSDTVTITMNNANATANSKTYYTADAVSKQNGTTGIYFYEKDHIYSIRSFNVYANAVLELQLYNDTASINHSWISTPADSGKVNGTPVQEIATILQKGLTKVLSGKTYTNVIAVDVDIQYDLGFGYQATSDYVYYLCKGIGILGYNSTYLGEDTEDESIISYTIK